mmetsp:Transcript_21361/g.48262  ORF Transcript_21361/g.48262 Transcript_21361/m.48262 type:complete len:274 (-) Transcript_21361:2542-3363(-)
MLHMLVHLPHTLLPLVALNHHLLPRLLEQSPRSLAPLLHPPLLLLQLYLGVAGKLQVQCVLSLKLRHQLHVLLIQAHGKHVDAVLHSLLAVHLLLQPFHPAQHRLQPLLLLFLAPLHFCLQGCAHLLLHRLDHLADVGELLLVQVSLLLHLPVQGCAVSPYFRQRMVDPAAHPSRRLVDLLPVLLEPLALPALMRFKVLQLLEEQVTSLAQLDVKLPYDSSRISSSFLLVSPAVDFLSLALLMPPFEPARSARGREQISLQLRHFSLHFLTSL